MKRRDNSRYGNLLSYVDMLFALLIGVFSIFIISTMLLGTPQKTGKIENNDQAMIFLTWDDMSPDDMDLWVKAPDGTMVGYANHENCCMSLDRDDRGVEAEDTKEINGKKIYERHNEEITRMRRLVPGHYIVNVMFYSRHVDPEFGTKTQGPQTVTVRMMRVNPAYTVLYARTFQINKEGDQETAFSFDILPGDPPEITNFNTLRVPFLNFHPGGYDGNDQPL